MPDPLTDDQRYEMLKTLYKELPANLKVRAIGELAGIAANNPDFWEELQKFTGRSHASLGVRTPFDSPST